MAVKHGRRRNRLTERQVKTLTKPGRYADGGGLYLRIGSGAARRWVFRFTYAGQVQEMGLGSAHDVTLATARQLAATARQAKANGENPLSLRRAEKSVPHFGDFALKTIASLSPQWKSPKHAAQWRIMSQRLVMAWMPPPDGIAMCHGDVSWNVTEKGESIHVRS